MNQPMEFLEPKGSVATRNAMFAVGALLLIGLAYYIYLTATSIRSVKVDSVPPTAINMLPPPPPPPPPPPEPQPKVPQPSNEPTPVPQPTPAPTPNQPAPMTINGPAQAGTDSYGVGAGSGGGGGAPGGTGTCIGTNCGTGGGGISTAFYNRYLSSELQDRIQDNSKLNREVFSASFAITVSRDGRITRAQLIQSSGRDDRDQILLAVLQSIRGLDAPPTTMQFPQRITVRGKKSF